MSVSNEAKRTMLEADEQARNVGNNIVNHAKEWKLRTQRSLNESWETMSEKTGNYRTPLLIVFGVICFTLFVWVIVVLVKKGKKKPGGPGALLDTPISGMTDLTLPGDSFPRSSSGFSCTYSIFVYVKDWRYRSDSYKEVFSKGKPEIACPSLHLAPHINDAVFSIRTDKQTFHEFWIRDIDLHKWCQFGITIQDHKVEIYYKGKLQSSHVIPSLPDLNTHNLTIGGGGGFSGVVAHLAYMPQYCHTEDMEAYAKQVPSTNAEYFNNENN